MQMESDVSNKFICYLKEHGYPEESIVSEWKIGNYRVDIAIIDVQTKQVMVIYEIKNNVSNVETAYDQIKKYLSDMGNYSIPAYIVYGANNELGFVVRKVEHNNKKLDISLPDYSIIQNSFNSGYIVEKTNQKKKIIDTLNIVCVIMSLCVTTILILDIVGCFEMTTNRIILLGIIIGLFIFQFFKSVKILGIEIQRKTRE